VRAVVEVEQADLHTHIIDLPAQGKVKGRVDPMRIGEVAELAGLSTKALRYYEHAGLIDEPARTPSGYRDYDDGVLDRLRFIRAAQAVGLTLGDIKGVITFRERGSPPCGHVLELIERRAADLDRRIAELGAPRDDLRRLARRGRSLSRDACSPGPGVPHPQPSPG
jgi:DNA-binding transcriptional MerR regulator